MLIERRSHRGALFLYLVLGVVRTICFLWFFFWDLSPFDQGNRAVC